MDGISVCRQIRTFCPAPVIILSARDQELDKVLGLEVGADDYVTKPFSSRELLARIHAHLRRQDARSGNHDPGKLSVGSLIMDTEACTVSLEGQPVELTSREFGLLQVLMGRPGRVFTREELGLAIVEEIVTQSGGAVDVTSQPGKGTSFEIWFQVVPLDATNNDLSPN